MLPRKRSMTSDAGTPKKFKSKNSSSVKKHFRQDQLSPFSSPESPSNTKSYDLTFGEALSAGTNVVTITEGQYYSLAGGIATANLAECLGKEVVVLPGADENVLEKFDEIEINIVSKNRVCESMNTSESFPEESTVCNVQEDSDDSLEINSNTHNTNVQVRMSKGSNNDGASETINVHGDSLDTGNTSNNLSFNEVANTDNGTLEQINDLTENKLDSHVANAPLLLPDGSRDASDTAEESSTDTCETYQIDGSSLNDKDDLPGFKQYMCHHCPELFSLSEELVKHLTTHWKEMKKSDSASGKTKDCGTSSTEVPMLTDEIKSEKTTDCEQVSGLNSQAVLSILMPQVDSLFNDPQPSSLSQSQPWGSDVESTTSQETVKAQTKSGKSGVEEKQVKVSRRMTVPTPKGEKPHALLPYIVLPDSVLSDHDILKERWNIERLITAMVDNDSSLVWLARRGLIRNSCVCVRCRRNIFLKQATKKKGERAWYCWHCRRAYNARCRSFFAVSQLPLSDMVMMIYFWAYEFPASDVQRELAVSSSEVASWRRQCREECERYLLKDEALGGVNPETSKPFVVEISRTRFFEDPLKEDTTQGIWVLGGIDRNSKKCFVVDVPDITPSTVEPIIEQYVKPGTHIISSNIPAFKNLKTLKSGYKHSVFERTRGFINPKNLDMHLQNIECLWSLLKKKMQQKKVQVNELPGFLKEYMWRRLLDKADPFVSFLLSLKQVYAV